MEPWVTITIAVLSSGACTAVVTALVNYKINKKLAEESRKKTKEDGIASGVQILLEERIDRIAKKNIEQGFVYEDDRSRLVRMWKVYHEQLGGNGYLDTVMGLLMELPVKVR